VDDDTICTVLLGLYKVPARYKDEVAVSVVIAVMVESSDASLITVEFGRISKG